MKLLHKGLGRMESTSLKELIIQYKVIESAAPDYRLGQHFINQCIKKEDNSFDYHLLWKEKDETRAQEQILLIINKLQWDVDKLPLCVTF